VPSLHILRFLVEPRFLRTGVAIAALLACGPSLAGCGDSQGRSGEHAATLQPAPGIEVHRRWPPGRSEVGNRDLPVTLVHVDPERYEFRLLTAERHGAPRTAEQWLGEFDLLGVINASMYMPNLRSTGLMIDDDKLNNPAVNPRFQGVFAFGARDEADPPVVFTGTDCEGFDLDELRARYRSVVQNYRLLDCEGTPLHWEDRKLYSAAAIGLDRRGWVVFVHSGSPSRTQDLARWLAQPKWGLVAAHFVEGGTDASLLVQTERAKVAVIGGYEGGIGGRSFQAVPNVIGFVSRTRDAHSM
jgi:hypothetical protein